MLFYIYLAAADNLCFRLFNIRVTCLLRRRLLKLHTFASLQTRHLATRIVIASTHTIRHGVSGPQLPATPRADDWAFFKRQFANYLLIAEAKDSHRAPLLLNALGRDGLDIYDGLPDSKETYTDIVARFDEYFSGKASILLRRKYFFEARQIRTESVTEFACRLRRLIKECDFTAAIGATLLRDIFVVGIYSNILGERLLAEDASTLTFDKAINMAEAFERARSERQTVEQCAIVSAVRDDTARFRRAEERWCYNCKATGHVRNACPLTASREASKQLLPKVSPTGAKSRGQKVG